MLEIEVFDEKSRFYRIMDYHNSSGELELAMGSWDQKLTGQARIEFAMASKLLDLVSRQLAMASLTAQHVLSTRLVAGKSYPRPVLAVFC